MKRLAGAIISCAVVCISCTFEFQTPHITISAEPAYPQRNVLIPFFVRGDGETATVVWELQRFESPADDWVDQGSRQSDVASDTSGILQYELEQGRYRLTGQVLTNRGGVAASAPSLTETVGFYVDQERPVGTIGLTPNQVIGPPFDAAQPLTVTAHIDEPDVNFEAPVRLYYRIDSTRIPDMDDLSVEPGGVIELGPGDGVPYIRALSIIAIDDAGNIGARSIEVYEAL